MPVLLDQQNQFGLNLLSEYERRAVDDSGFRIPVAMDRLRERAEVKPHILLGRRVPEFVRGKSSSQRFHLP